MTRPSLRDLAELVRLPAALTVPGDSLAGAAYAGDRATPRRWALPAASACLYWGGMALNDWADRDLDATERPERPLPSGRVAPDHALALGLGLCGGGVAVAALAGGAGARRIAAPLAALVATYDLLAKPTPLGPLVMASTRGLDVLLGAAPAPGLAARPAAAVAAHTAAVTLLSRGEVHGCSPRTAAAATAVTGVVAAATALSPWRTSGTRRRDRLAATGLALAYAATVTRAQADAVQDPSGPRVRAATGTGIRGLVLLQGAWLAGRGRLAEAAGVVLAGPALRRASQMVSPT